MKDTITNKPLDFMPGPDAVFFTDLVNHGYSQFKGNRDPASLDFAVKYIRRENLVFTSPRIAREYFADEASGASAENWNCEKLLTERFTVNHPFFFIEIIPEPVSQLRAGCLIEVFDRNEFSLDVLEDDEQRRRFVRASKLLLDETAANHSSMKNFTPFIRWQLTLGNLLLTHRLTVTARIEAKDDEFYHPSWEMGALLEHCPQSIERFARLTAFQYCHICRRNEVLSPQWFLMFGGGGRLVSQILHQPLDPLETTSEALTVYNEIENFNRSKFLIPALFSWAAMQDEPPALISGAYPNIVSGSDLLRRLRASQPSAMFLSSDHNH